MRRRTQPNKSSRYARGHAPQARGRFQRRRLHQGWSRLPRASPAPRHQLHPRAWRKKACVSRIPYCCFVNRVFSAYLCNIQGIVTVGSVVVSTRYIISEKNEITYGGTTSAKVPTPGEFIAAPGIGRKHFATQLRYSDQGTYLHRLRHSERVSPNAQGRTTRRSARARIRTAAM